MDTLMISILQHITNAFKSRPDTLPQPVLAVGTRSPIISPTVEMQLFRPDIATETTPTVPGKPSQSTDVSIAIISSSQSQRSHPLDPYITGEATESADIAAQAQEEEAEDVDSLASTIVENDPQIIAGTWKIIQIIVILANIVIICVIIWTIVLNKPTCYAPSKYLLWFGLAPCALSVISAVFITLKLPAFTDSNSSAYVRSIPLHRHFFWTRVPTVMYHAWMLGSMILLAQGPVRGCMINRSNDTVFQVSYNLTMTLVGMSLMVMMFYNIAICYGFVIGGLQNQDHLAPEEGQRAGVPRAIIRTMPATEYEESYRNTTCSICQADFEAGNMVKIMPCEHQFHPSCIHSWLRRSRECPDCRHVVTEPAPEVAIMRRRAGSPPLPPPPPAVDR
eukprot:Partr_v1_DN28582_c0_g1_i1_m73235